ncbi:MAG: hypothetical protein NVS1B14_10570 [Vulcanimicrobiaceae bacterium]
MPAHHRFHPYEIQSAAFMISMIPCFAAMFLAFAGRHVEELQRSLRPASVAALQGTVLSPDSRLA